MNDISDDDKAKTSIEEIQKGSDQGTVEDVGKERDTMEGLPPLGTRERVIAEKKLLKKLDMRLLPTIFVIYIMNYIDVCALSLSILLSGSRLMTLAERYHYCTVERHARRFKN